MHGTAWLISRPTSYAVSTAAMGRFGGGVLAGRMSAPQGVYIYRQLSATSVRRQRPASGAVGVRAATAAAAIYYYHRD